MDEEARLDEVEIKRLAIIYGRKEMSRPLTNYEKRMNEASVEICLNRPGFLRKSKSERLAAARAKIIDEGFQFVKGKSRSNKDSHPAPPSKRKQTKDIREWRLNELDDQLKDLNERIGYKEQRIEAAVNMKNFKKADDVKEEIISLKLQRREIVAERKLLQNSEKRSKQYFKRKQHNDSESCSTSGHSRSVTPFSDTDNELYNLDPQLGAENNELVPRPIMHSPGNYNNSDSDATVILSPREHNPSTCDCVLCRSVSASDTSDSFLHSPDALCSLSYRNDTPVAGPVNAAVNNSPEYPFMGRYPVQGHYISSTNPNSPSRQPF